MYITVEELQSYLWIEFEDESIALTLINWVESAVNSYIGAENWILKQEYEEMIDIRSIFVNEDWYNVYLKHWPVDIEEWLSINWEVIDNTENPYMIIRGRQFIIKDLDCILNRDNPKERWNWIKVKYTAWYWEYDEETQTRTNIPDDIKVVCLFLCSVIWITRQYTWMTNYRLWDESISLWRRNFIYETPIVSETLKKYRKIYIAY